MKVHVLNDLHVEFEPFDPPETDAEVVILGGDIHVGKKGLKWAQENFKGKPVIYVLGNHEYYGQAIPKHTDKLKELAEGTNVHILENDIFVINEVMFLGCTLWTNFKLWGNPQIAGDAARQKMTDYKKIRVSPQYRKIKPIDTVGIHYKSLNWLGENLIKTHDAKVVVITHHAPSPRSFSEKHQEDILGAAYVSHLDDFVEKSGAALWIHGHLHVQRDYMIGNTRVLCNSRGYPDEYNNEFIADYEVEI
ncbi:metallophosphoesterase [Planctomycetota bacterium]